MLKIGDKVKLISVDGNVNDAFFERIGIIDKINVKEHYCYHLSFLNSELNNEGKFFWWSEENVALTDEEVDNCETNNLNKLRKMSIAKARLFPNLGQAVLFLLGLLGVQFLVAILVTILVGIFSGIFGLKYEISSDYNIVVLNILIANIIMIKIGCKKSGNTIKHMFKSPQRNYKNLVYSLILLIGWWCIIIPIVSILITSSTTLHNSGQEVGKTLGGMATGIFGFVYIILIGPFLEEILFRGIILKGLLRNYNPTKAIIISAILFGVFHFNLLQSPVAFGIGLILALVYVKTGSLKMCVLIHVINNTLVGLVGHLIGVNIYLSLVLGIIIVIFPAIKIFKGPNRFEDIILTDKME